MTLNSYKFKFSRNFQLLRSFELPIYHGCRALTFVLAGLSCCEWRQNLCSFFTAWNNSLILWRYANPPVKF